MKSFPLPEIYLKKVRYEKDEVEAMYCLLLLLISSHENACFAVHEWLELSSRYLTSFLSLMQFFLKTAFPIIMAQ